MTPQITHWVEGENCCDPTWEAAYARFESAEDEIRKFTERFHRLGVDRWDSNSNVLDLFCGRGNGLAALTRLGFTRLSGVDLSPDLLKKYAGSAALYVGDARELQLEDHSFDAVTIQGGLHHLPRVPEDVERTFAEIARVLVPGGKFVAVEPWLTPFLRLAHFCSLTPGLRHAWGKLHALGTMIELERTTYFNWLGKPEAILAAFDRHFDRQHLSIRRGKVEWIGTSR